MRNGILKTFLGLAGLFVFLSTSFALPPPLPLEDLCKQSDFIIKGEYVGGMVGDVNDCQFWVTFQVKPEKFYKKPAGSEELKLIQFRKRYFEETKACAKIPGPNAMPAQLTEDLKKPKHDKKVFFLKDVEGQIEELSSAFWGIVDWDQAPKEWHKEFKENPSCHPVSRKTY